MGWICCSLHIAPRTTAQAAEEEARVIATETHNKSTGLSACLSMDLALYESLEPEFTMSLGAALFVSVILDIYLGQAREIPYTLLSVFHLLEQKRVQNILIGISSMAQIPHI